MSNNTHDKFPGFPDSLQKASWQFPSIINGFVHTLNGAEFKVLWYILRHTFGWQKTSDKISISQICKGIQRKDGIWIDKGTGLSRKWIMKSLTALEERGFISVLKESGKVSRISVNIVNNEDTGVESTLVPVEQSTPVTGVESTPTITNSTIYNTNILSKDNTKPNGFGNPDINELISSFKVKFNLTDLDGSITQNRQYANLLIKKFKTKEEVLRIIDIASKDNFWSNKITSFTKLYYKAVEILQSSKSKKQFVEEDIKKYEQFK